MKHDLFIAGDFNLAFPPAVRTRLFSKLVNRPGHYLELYSYGVQSQTVLDFFLWELLVNNRPVFTEEIYNGSGHGDILLPFLRFDAVGFLEMYVTIPGAAPTELSGHVWGQYVPCV